MMRRLTWLLALWLGLVGSALAADDEVAFDDPVLNARYYSLTPEGRKRLREETANWRRYARAVEMLLEGR